MVFLNLKFSAAALILDGTPGNLDTISDKGMVEIT